jgi:hypothetical protein
MNTVGVGKETDGLTTIRPIYFFTFSKEKKEVAHRKEKKKKWKVSLY